MDGMETVSVQVVDELEAMQHKRVLELVNSAHRHDGVAPLNEHALLHLGDRGGSIRHLLGLAGGRLVGYAFVDRSGGAASQVECVVEPQARGEGMGRALVRAAVQQSGDRPVAIWAHGDLPAATAVARHTGLRRARELRRMSRDLGTPLPPAAPPDGVVLRTFRPGVDDEAWVALNARAFASHPEQGALTVADLRTRQALPWFDPAGFFLAERAGRLVGFHWTKVHTDQSPAVGEVYVIGVDPQAQGGGVGRALTLHGLHHLQAAGLGSVQLYVEADNSAALRVYEALGFTIAGVDAQYRS